MMNVSADLRHALRLALRQPGFTAVVVITLALGIGANAAVFSAVNGLLLRPAPFAEPDRLVRIHTVRGDAEGPVSVPEFDAIRTLPQIEKAAMYTDQGMYNASGFGMPEELAATITNHNLFRVLGVEPFLGSTFPANYDRTRNFGLVISHGLWQRKFGGDPHIVGRSMTLDGAPGYTIYGVMPAGFTFPAHADLFRSSGISPSPEYYQRREVRTMSVVGRLRPGVSIAQAHDAVAALGRRLEAEFPATNGGLSFKVSPLRELYTGAVRHYVLLVFGAAGVVLLITCANVASLLLARVTARERELAVRAALGAGRWRIVRQLVIESALLSALGAALAVLVVFGSVFALSRLVPVTFAGWMRIDVDLPVLLFLAATAALTGVIAGVIPALRASGTDLHGSLKDGARGASAGRRQQQLRRVFVVAQIALAVVLLVAAALLLQTVRQLQRVPLGFDVANTLTFRVELGWAAYGTLAKTRTFHDRVLERLRALPPVEAVTFDTNLPMSGKPRDPQPVRLYGESPDQQGTNPFVSSHLVGPDYFRVMGIPILSGRTFTPHDRQDTEPVAVVSRRMAERLWPGEDPLGRRFQFADTTRSDVWLTVVGVSGAVLHHELDAGPALDVYCSYTQMPTAGPWYVIRARGDVNALIDAATSIIGQIDPNQSFLDVQAYDVRIANRMWQRRLAATLFVVFAALAVLLALVGLYGVLGQSVTQRRRDFGVRLALGADRRNILRLVMSEGVGMAALGAVIGLALAVLLGRVLSSALFGVSATDPVTLLVVPLGLVATAAVASLLPARRATNVDPIVALRAD